MGWRGQKRVRRPRSWWERRIVRFEDGGTRAFSSAPTIEQWPTRHAPIKAVLPWESCMSTDARWWRSSFAMESWPRAHAQMSAEHLQ